MSDGQVTPQVDEKEAQARLCSFEVGIGHICRELGVDYDTFAKAANSALPMVGMEKFAAADEDAPVALAPWLVDQVVQAATAAESQKQS